MQNTTPFDLNQAIQCWRENLAQSPAFRSENLYELETHLRDSIVRLQSAGLSAEEAFLVATRRIGNAGALENEYATFNGSAVWMDRALWMLIGIQFWSVVSNVVFPIASGSVAFSLIHYDFSRYGQTIPVILNVLVNLMAFAASVAFCWWVIDRRGARLVGWASNLIRHRHPAYLVIITVLALSSLSMFALMINSGMMTLQMNTMHLDKYGEIARSQPYFWITGRIVQTITFATLMFFFARKRLRLNAE